MGREIVGKARIVPSSLLLMAALVSGCKDAVEPTQPAGDLPAASAGTAQARAKARGIDAEFSRLATRIPGFAGMYFDKAGKLNVNVKSQAGAAARAAELLGQLRAAGSSRVQDRLRKAPSVITHQARYDYLQLQDWKSRLGVLFGIRGVVFTDIDEARNQLQVGITRGASQRQVEQALARAGVPRAAVVIRRTSPIEKMVTLRNRFRPVPGGVQILFPAPSEGPDAAFICSHGFNAQPEGRPARFFVTASHCSDIQGGNQNTVYYQPTKSSSSDNRIAHEFNDPAYGNPGGLCDDYPDSRCRLSDALLARYRTGIRPEFGTIARTTFGLQRIGSLIIDEEDPRWIIAGELAFPFEGEIAHKVGRSTGWTMGPVILTCVDVGVNNSDIVQICQDIVLAGVRPGDSGAPVFERIGQSLVLLTGLLWGGGTLDGAPVFVFSPMENIEFELGQLTTEVGLAMASAQ
jgi:hypothetical protein